MTTHYGVTINRGLTATELMALGHALAGLNGPQSAQAMGCSLKTVEQTFEKLRIDFGARSKTQLVAALSASIALDQLPPATSSVVRYGRQRNPRPVRVHAGGKVRVVWELAA